MLSNNPKTASFHSGDIEGGAGLTDVTFPSSVSISSCRHEAAMICFTVMDFDMMTTNDFEGEAFLRVTQVAGVDGTGNILNVTPMELPLLQPKEKSKHQTTCSLIL